MMATVRKSLHTLQPAAGDKENLVGPGRMIQADKDNLKSLRETNENEISTPTESKVPSNKQKKVVSKSVQVGQLPTLTAEDITATVPSENYWQLLAERRRIALEEALEENEKLHEKIERLQEENKIFREALEEHENLVEVLKDMLNDPADESVNINDSLDG